MLTKSSILSEYVRLNKLYRDVGIEVFNDGDGYTIIIYCDLKPDDKIEILKKFDRLIICIGMEKVEYEDIDILNDDEAEELRRTFREIGRYDEAKNIGNRITGKVDYTQYKYKFIIPIQEEYKIKNYK